ncbi:MAG TPA: hypothetical protein VEB19_18845 [Gemmatimonadaceae bacterium]|nr:hypothetical protein [Gemmatimonadaceae bacterium]
MNHATRADIASRLRSLLAGEDLAAAARRLGVDEVSLRMSVDDVSPHPTIDVLVAVVRHCAVDPSYLLTGVYDATAHRRAMDANPGAIDEAVREYVQRDLETHVVSRPTPEPSTLRAIP